MTLSLCRCSGRDGFARIVGTEDFVCARCGLPRPGFEQMASGGLAFFRGGPMDGRVYEYANLMGTEALVLPVNEYAWTVEKITGQTGRTARVWVWREDYPLEQDTSEPITVIGQTQEEQHIVATENISENDFETRRQALGLSRPQLATLSGITVSVIASVEKHGLRVKEGVKEAMDAALTKAETDIASAAEGDEPAADEEDHTPEDEVSKRRSHKKKVF